MIERARSTEQASTADNERATILDDRLLHMTREEMKAYLDEYVRQRGLATADGHAEQDGKA